MEMGFSAGCAPGDWRADTVLDSHGRPGNEPIDNAI